MSISNYYTNNYVIYTLSGSVTSDGTSIDTPVTGSSGKCRLEPYTDDEGASKLKVFMNVVELDNTDTLQIDGTDYVVNDILNYFDHHLEIIISNT